MNYTALSVPTPFPVGPLNVYLINEDPVTVIDCGPYSLEARTALKEQLAALGLKFESIQRILITHAHVDHYGLAAEIQRRLYICIIRKCKKPVIAWNMYNRLLPT